ncbi:MAG: hypothetical protein JMN24_09610 [gamma proteobacterium endosymbiont of Lamellibrachia anaximandri]|nr:hypothetical protein [gamma proteobacterium endosymbiont of Lamellibrachia anaximandri]MBL3617825.1 hypothetical protein [gamma proteobacterium endosymbiont of Lamellibrachia anaximandri]
MHVITLLIGTLFIPTASAAGSATTGSDPETGLAFWRYEAEGILFELNQRLPDQTRAFFQARGFDTDTANQFATSCVFQSRLLNTAVAGGASLQFNLNEWRVISGNKSSSMATTDDWMPRWKKQSIGQAARIAFKWSLLPSEQTYAPGDYNWGMTSYDQPPGTRFNLTLVWHREGKRESATIRNIECPADSPQETP